MIVTHIWLEWNFCQDVLYNNLKNKVIGWNTSFTQALAIVPAIKHFTAKLHIILTPHVGQRPTGSHLSNFLVMNNDLNSSTTHSFLYYSPPGVFQCGPAPLEAVRKGRVGYSYDVGFVLAEVNADLVRWLKDKSKEFGFSRMEANKYQ